jgi:beta-N-acetylhexosaminidase
MTADLKRKIGQMLLVGIGGFEPSALEQRTFRRYGFGGFILFKHNCREPLQLYHLCRSLLESAAEELPFIAIDQEGGPVHRLPSPFTHFPAAGSIGRAGPALAYKAGRAAAVELAMLGINLNFAPVLDIDSNPRNPIIGERSFGSTSEQVIDTAWEWARGLRSVGIIPCGKHFPGHGGTDRDSHRELPVVEKSSQELRMLELAPFVHACSKGIEALMTAHVLFPGLDQQFPASLSSEVIGGVLRAQLGYDGVVFSDDLEMKAVTDNFAAEEAALLCIAAGTDVLLCGRNLAQAVVVFEALHRAAERDAPLRMRIDESYARIRNLKKRYLIRKFTGMSGDWRERLSRLKHGELAAEIQGSL